MHCSNKERKKEQSSGPVIASTTRESRPERRRQTAMHKLLSLLDGHEDGAKTKTKTKSVNFTSPFEH